ncbi:MAG: hypothetical protein WCG79_06615 [Verrucomicrobiota bacterium]
MALLKFLNGLETSPMMDFWKMEEHDLPSRSGAYILVAASDVRFNYPKGRSPVYYIGQSQSLRQRLLRHYVNSKEARDRRKHPMYWPRYEYGAAFGARYCYILAWQGKTAKALEDKVMAQFARCYHAWPVANSAGAWNRIWDEVGGD